MLVSRPADKVARRATSDASVTGQSQSSTTGDGVTGERALAEPIQQAPSASPPIGAAPTAASRIQRAQSASRPIAAAPSAASRNQRAGSTSPPIAAAPTAVGRIQRARLADADVIHREPNKKGDEVIADLSRPDWSPPGARADYEPARSTSADQMNTLLRSAAIAAYTTYAYHATKSRNAEGIRRDGLDPDRGGSGAAKGSDFEQHSRNKVHYARNLNTVGAYK